MQIATNTMNEKTIAISKEDMLDILNIIAIADTFVRNNLARLYNQNIYVLSPADKDMMAHLDIKMLLTKSGKDMQIKSGDLTKLVFLISCASDMYKKWCAGRPITCEYKENIAMAERIVKKLQIVNQDS